MTGEAWGYSHWGPGEPSGVNADGSDYVHLYYAPAIPGDQRDWNDGLVGGGGGPSPWGENWGYLGEFGHYTDPLNADTDGDGFNDGAEVTAGSSPVDAQSTPITVGLARGLDWWGSRRRIPQHTPWSWGTGTEP